MSLKVTVIDEVKPCQNPKYRKQTVDVHAGGRHPIESSLLLGEQDHPVAAGEYTCSTFREDGYNIVLDLSARNLVKAK